MKVTFVNRMVGIRRSGGGIWDLRIAENLRDLGVDINFCVAKPLTTELPEPITEFDCIEVPTPHLHDIAYASPPGIGGAIASVDASIFTQRASKKLTQVDSDIIHITARPEFSRYTDRFNSFVTIGLHGPPYSFWHDVLKPFSSSYDLLSQFDQIISTGVTTQEVRKHTDCDAKTVNPGVNTATFTPDSDRKKGGKKILYVGRFVPIKNLTLLIEAFSEICEPHPDAELVLIGDGPLRKQLKKKATSLGITNRVQFLGYIANHQLPEYYNDAAVFALSSHHDNYPITLLEAMSCGTPVVAPKVGGIPDIIDDGENGLLYEPESQKGLTDALNTILSDVDLAEKLGNCGRRKAVDDFDWGRRAKKLKSIYESLL